MRNAAPSQFDRTGIRIKNARLKSCTEIIQLFPRQFYCHRICESQKRRSAIFKCRECPMIRGPPSPCLPVNICHRSDPSFPSHDCIPENNGPPSSAVAAPAKSTTPCPRPPQPISIARPTLFGRTPTIPPSVLRSTEGVPKNVCAAINSSGPNQSSDLSPPEPPRS